MEENKDSRDFKVLVSYNDISSVFIYYFVKKMEPTNLSLEIKCFESDFLRMLKKKKKKCSRRGNFVFPSSLFVS